jgi:tetratricopeptide (TPR) repeat protein
MPLRYLFGPVTSAFADQHLHDAVAAGDCLPFNHVGDVGLQIRPADCWEEVIARFPAGWRPDVIALVMHYKTAPTCLWTAPIPIIGLAGDWNLLFHYYRLRLPSCEVVAVDANGVDVCRRAGIEQARPFVIYGCGRAFLAAAVREEESPRKRDIDIGFVGNLRASVQADRMTWLARLAKLSDRWQVEIRTGIHDDEYRSFLGRTRIAFNRSIRGECNQRAFEAAACGALLFQERANREVSAFFEDRRECVYYDEDNLESLLEYYLTNEEERASIAAAGRHRVRSYGFGSLWQQFIQELEGDWSTVVERVSRRPVLDAGTELLVRTWQAIGSSFGGDPTLQADIRHVLNQQKATSNDALALGIASWLGQQTAGPSMVNADLLQARMAFENALLADPEHSVALLNLVEVLARLGESDKAVALARRGLVWLAGCEQLSSAVLSSPHYPPYFDDFRVRWEAAAWKNAGDLAGESVAKIAMLRGRLHSLVAAITKDVTHFHEAALADPDASAYRLALGCALGSMGRPAEAAVHLEDALNINPFEPTAARSLYQAFREIGAAARSERVAADRRQLWKAAPQEIVRENWFAASREDRTNGLAVDGNRPRLSLCMIVKNEEQNLGDCLRTVADIVDELVIVDTGSTDGTKDIAASFGARLFDFPWIDSFCAARNESLRHARGKWIFWLDADDRLDEDNRVKLRRLAESLDNDNLAFVMKCRCLCRDDASGPTVVDHIRLFRNHPQLTWEHRVHEQILPSLRRNGATVRWTDVVITHTGYVDRATVRRKQERDLRLLLLEREEMDDHPFTLFNLGSTYLELGLPKSALPVLQRSLERSQPSDSITRKLYVLLSQTFRHLGRPAEALDVCGAGRKHFPNNAELLFQEACVRDELGDLVTARRCLESALGSPEEQHFASVSEGLAGPHMRLLLAQLWAKEGAEAEAERSLQEGIEKSPQWVPLWVELGQLYLNGKRLEELERLCRRMDQTVGPTMAASVLSARSKMARGAFKDAIELLRATTERHPQALWPRVILSHALLQQGLDFQAAESALKAILELDPGNQEATRNLSILSANFAKTRAAQ